MRNDFPRQYRGYRLSLMDSGQKMKTRLWLCWRFSRRIELPKWFMWMWCHSCWKILEFSRMKCSLWRLKCSS